MERNGILKPSIAGSLNPNWKGGLCEKTCEHCGCGFRTKPVHSNARFCSIACCNRHLRQGLGRVKTGKVEMPCRWCGRQFTVYACHLGRSAFCSRPCHRAWRSSRMCASGNPNWNGGTSEQPYPFNWPLLVIARDGGVCKNPLCWGTCSRLNVHHIDHDKGNCSGLNLITLCASCNGRANFNREFWKKLYVELLQIPQKDGGGWKAREF